MGAHRSRNGGQVNEPKTITTGFSISKLLKLTVFLSTSSSVKSTALSPMAKPTLSKSPERLVRFMSLMRSFDSTGPTLSEACEGISVVSLTGAGMGTSTDGWVQPVTKRVSISPLTSKLLYICESYLIKAAISILLSLHMN